MLEFLQEYYLNYILGGATALTGLFIVYISFMSFRMKEEIEDTPTSKIRSLAAGLVEVNGTVIPREVLFAPFSKRRCVYYEYRKERLQVTRTYNPMSRRWIVTREWVQVSRDDQTRRFYLQDDTGKVLVDPAGAEVTDSKTFTQWFVQPRLRHTERIILCGSVVYIMGTATQNPEKDASDVASDLIMIKKGDVRKEFIISTKQEKQLMAFYGLQFLITLGFGVLIMALGVWIAFFSS